MIIAARSGALFLESPHIDGHLRSGRPIDVPIEKQAVAAVFVPAPCHPPASISILAIGGRHMAGIPHIA
jgi:hypothetical protein